GLAVPGIYRLQNSMEESTVTNTNTKKRINSVFGGVSVGWNDLIFVDFTGRNDWSSTLPKSDNSYFYPGITGSFLFSELIDSEVLSFGKLRGGYSQVRNDTSPYQLLNTFSNSSLSPIFIGVPGYTNQNTKKNDLLKPESISTWEVGVEAAFLQRRLE